MKHLDLCSGIGGFALAASWVWPEHEVLAFVEIDDYCRRVLRKHWPDAPIHNDLRTFDARPFRGTVDLLTGGYPCPPYSVSGKRKGAKDDRDLWPEVRRVVEECLPRWTLFENVDGHVTLGLDSVLSDLEGLGYACEAAVIPACAVDAPHRRDRVWIIAYADLVDDDDQRHGTGAIRGQRPEAAGIREREVVANANSTGSQRRIGKVLRECSAERPVGPSGAPVAYTNSNNRQRRTCDVQMGRIGFAQEITRDGRAGRTEWRPEPAVGRVADGIPSRVDRLRALGNAIVPQVAAEIMRAMEHANQ